MTVLPPYLMMMQERPTSWPAPSGKTCEQFPRWHGGQQEEDERSLMTGGGARRQLRRQSQLPQGDLQRAWRCCSKPNFHGHIALRSTPAPPAPRLGAWPPRRPFGARQRAGERLQSHCKTAGRRGKGAVGSHSPSGEPQLASQHGPLPQAKGPPPHTHLNLRSRSEGAVAAQSAAAGRKPSVKARLAMKTHSVAQ